VLDLAGGGARHLHVVDEGIGTRPLEAGDALAAPGPERFDDGGWPERVT
jgi:hypothetical protein